MRTWKAVSTGTWLAVVLVAAAVVVPLLALGGCGKDKKLEEEGAKWARVRHTVDSLRQIGISVHAYEKDYDVWPVDLGDVLDLPLPNEELSSEKGNNGVQPTFDGSGGWVYNADSKTLQVNVSGTVAEILKSYKGEEAQTKPSEWKVTFYDDDDPVRRRSVVEYE